jgi:hypothetical protein
LEVSVIWLGYVGMDHAYGTPANREEMIKLIRRAVELVCDFFDTTMDQPISLCAKLELLISYFFHYPL